MAYAHYIFGYGSLICPSSRVITAPTLQNRMATPVLVRHLERVWSFPVEFCGMTFMGIRHRENASCVGVLVPVNDEELDQFDLREGGYQRVPLEHERIQKIAFLENRHYPQQHSYFDCALQSGATTTATTTGLPNVWVYMQLDPRPINRRCPLAQTYLDVIMRGCLSISPEFCKEFLRTTRGWSAEDFYNDGEGRDGGEVSVYWVDDRRTPLYVRADVEYSRTRGLELDRLLQELRPTEMAQRRSRNPRAKEAEHS